MRSQKPIWVIPDDAPWLHEQAAQRGLATSSTPPERGFYLIDGRDGLTLRHADSAASDTGLCLDFLGRKASQRAAGGKQSALARAFGLHRHPPYRVLDTTCGLGRDSLMLATLGCHVTSLERQPALHALLTDAYERARNTVPSPDWLQRWALPELANALDWLGARSGPVCEAIYIDPMFDSPRRKAKPQKALAWLAELAGSDEDAPALLGLARRRASRRVVVKQHGRSTPLAPPDNQVIGKAVRFDIYLTAGAGNS